MKTCGSVYWDVDRSVGDGVDREISGELGSGVYCWVVINDGG